MKLLPGLNLRQMVEFFLFTELINVEIRDQLFKFLPPADEETKPKMVSNPEEVMSITTAVQDLSDEDSDAKATTGEEQTTTQKKTRKICARMEVLPHNRKEKKQTKRRKKG